MSRDAKTGMIVDQSVDGVDANAAGANFGYDKAGRLTSWWVRDAASTNRFQGTYNFTGYTGTAPGCGNTQWGRNSSRLSFERKTYNAGGTLLSTTVDQSCYDNADRLASYLPAAGASPYAGVSYDGHGNTVRMGGEVHGYDSADRHLATTAAITAGKQALLVVGNAAALSSRDKWLQSQLTALGWAVTVGDDDVVTTASASGKRLVMLSESVAQASVGTKFTSVAVPVVTAEAWMSDELGMTGTGTNQGNTTGGLDTQTTITAAGAAHPLGGGFSAGNVTIASPGVDVGWGKPNSNALVAATVAGDASKATVYGYQTGAQMVSGTAPAPRATWLHYTGSPANLNANAVTLFAALVSWATTTQVTYQRDAADRITRRTVNGTVVARYAHTAADDSPELVLDAAGAVVEKTISLPGGVLVTKRGSAATDVWSYPNLHGDITATTNGTGVKAGATKAYDPFGVPLGTTVPDNSAGELDYAWHGQQQRPLEHETGLQPLIEMGARQYDLLIGRFIQVDPIEGGTTTNDYGYVRDPVHTSDLNGLNTTGPHLSRQEAEAKYNKEHGKPYKKADYNSAMRKVRESQKRAGTRNEQKRASEKRGKNTNKRVSLETPVSSKDLWHNYNPNTGIVTTAVGVTAVTAAFLLLLVLAL